MAKFSGVIGFSDTKNVSPGVWEEKIIERRYKGDVLKNSRRWENSQNLNDNITVDNSLSIVADDFLYEKVYAIRYVEWMGALWKVKSVDIQRPRLVLSIGGVYNGPRPEGSDEPDGPQDPEDRA